MRYLLLFWTDPSRESPERSAAFGRRVEAWDQQMTDQGVLVLGQSLAEVEEARSVQVRNGEILLTDGPFAESKEQIGGFSIIDAASMEEALQVAASIPLAEVGTVEVRQFQER